ncbi:MAG: hypothetical protein LBH14_05130 [Desulfobulbaceae bacterium]|nr:hypothetical protein [Desulfobulbaceae bacterium]
MIKQKSIVLKKEWKGLLFHNGNMLCQLVDEIVQPKAEDGNESQAYCRQPG